MTETAGTAETAAEAAARAEIDALMGAFLAAFTNTGGRKPDVRAIHGLFTPQGTIVCNVGMRRIAYDLDGFVDPREKMLTDGTLTEFEEWETYAHTEVFGTVAQRFSRYAKRGVLRGEAFEGEGGKSTQFLLTPEGWRMHSMIWDDV